MERKCQCGAVVSFAEAVFCPECGIRLAETPPQPEATSGGMPEGQPRNQPNGGAQIDSNPAQQRSCVACGNTWDKEHQFCPESGQQTGTGQATAKLVIYTPDGDKKEAPLDGSTILIGKEEEATVKLDDRYLSRKHCRFVATDSGEYQVEDLDSSNGTFVKMSKPVPISPGSTFLVGNCLICVEED